MRERGDHDCGAEDRGQIGGSIIDRARTRGSSTMNYTEKMIALLVLGVENICWTGGVDFTKPASSEVFSLLSLDYSMYSILFSLSIIHSPSLQ